MKRTICALLAVLMVLGLVVGCSRGPKESIDTSTSTDTSQTTSGGGQTSTVTEINGADGDFSSDTYDDASNTTIACCMGSMNHPVHRVVQYSFVTEGRSKGYKAIISGLDEGSTQELIAKFESTFDNGAKGALVWSGDDTMYQMMRDYQGECVFVVPHFAHEYEDTKDFIARNITSTAKTYGEAAGKFVAERLAAKGVTSGMILCSESGPNVTENAAKDAFYTYIDKNTGFDIYKDNGGVVYETLEVTTAANALVAALTSHPEIVGCFGTTGGSAQAYAQAMKTTGRSDLVVCAIDYIEFNVNAVADGTITGIVCQPLVEEAKYSVDTIDSVLQGKSYNGSAASWFLELEAPVAWTGGTGNTQIETYRPIVNAVKEYYSD